MAEVRLRPMTPDEFRDYRRYAVDSYADDMERNVKMAPEAAVTHAETTMRELLPQGLDTVDHWIRVAEDEHGTRVGHLWFARRPTPAGTTIAYLFDIEVDAAQRGRGYGRALMELLEGEVAALNLSRIELNVFGHNEVARSLYTNLGYVEISRQLFKELDAG